MAAYEEGDERLWLTKIRANLLEVISVWLAGMLAGQVVVYAFIVEARELKYISTMGEWALAVGLVLLAVAIPAVVVYSEYLEAKAIAS